MANWTFTTPTVDEGPASWDDPLFLRVKLARGITVLETSGVYSSLRFPTQEELSAATTVYMGGHEYTVDDDVKAALIAADIDVTSANFTAQ